MRENENLKLSESIVWLYQFCNWNLGRFLLVAKPVDISFLLQQQKSILALLKAKVDNKSHALFVYQYPDALQTVLCFFDRVHYG